MLCHTHYIHTVSPRCGFSGVWSGVPSHQSLSYTRYKYRASRLCGFSHAQWGWSAHWRLFRSDHTHRVSRQCGFSGVERGRSSGQTSFHIHYKCTVSLPWARLLAFVPGSHTERFSHAQVPVTCPHYVCWHPACVGPSLQNSSFHNRHLSRASGFDSWNHNK